MNEKFCSEYDAWYDASTDEWLESMCDDPECEFCSGRPARPSDVPGLIIQKKKYWTISYPGKFGQHVQETFSEEQILKSYYKYWFHKMVEANKHDQISNENCIDDWRIVHWAEETNQFGEKIGN